MCVYVSYTLTLTYMCMYVYVCVYRFSYFLTSLFGACLVPHAVPNTKGLPREVQIFKAILDQAVICIPQGPVFDISASTVF